MSSLGEYLAAEGPKVKPMMIVAYSFKSLQTTFEARASEWALTGATLALALVFTLNDTMFYREAFEGLRSISNSQTVWALIFSIVGVFRLSVLLINGAYYRTPHFRSLTAFFTAGIWFVMSLGFLRNGSVLIAILPWLFFLDTYNAKRAGKEAGMSEFLQRHRNQGRKDAGTSTGPNG